MKCIKLEITPLMAHCLQRMLVDEIENQEWWKGEDRAVDVFNPQRDEIIKECKELQDEMLIQGIRIHTKV